jgi:hypothetical protein
VDRPDGGEAAPAANVTAKLRLVSDGRARDPSPPVADEPDRDDDDGFEGAFEAPDEVDATAQAAAVPAPAPLPVAAGTEADAPAPTDAVPDHHGGSRMKLTTVLDGVALASSVLDRLFLTVNRPLHRLTPQTRDLVGYVGLLTFFVGLAAILASVLFPR